MQITKQRNKANLLKYTSSRIMIDRQQQVESEFFIFSFWTAASLTRTSMTQEHLFDLAYFSYLTWNRCTLIPLKYFTKQMIDFVCWTMMRSFLEWGMISQKQHATSTFCTWIKHRARCIQYKLHFYYYTWLFGTWILSSL